MPFLLADMWPGRDLTPTGYDAGLKRRTCEASMRAGPRPFRGYYSAQLTDAGSTFVRADFRTFPDELAIALHEIVVPSRRQLTLWDVASHGALRAL